MILPRLRQFCRKVLSLFLVCWPLAAGWSAAALGLTESDFGARFSTQALPLVEKAKSRFFTGADNVQIAYRSLPASSGAARRGTVLFVHGYSESMLKHAEIIYDLTQAGYHVYALDLRGMGESDRLLDDRQIGHVRKFDDYVTDLSKFVTDIVTPNAERPLFLLAHSLGAMVSAEMLAKGPATFTAVAFSAPMFGIKTRGFPPWLVNAVVGVNILRGKGADFIPGRGHYDPSQDDGTRSNVTHSVARANATLALYRRRPELILGGQSNQWLAEAMSATDRAVKYAAKISVPMKIFQAEEDVIVTSEGQREFCAAAAHCELRTVAGARHEVLQEIDPIRTAVVSDILNFFGPDPLVN